MNPNNYNQKLAVAITDNMNSYVGHSKIIGNDIPKLSYLYKGFFTTAIPYTIANWGLRIAIFRLLNFNRESAIEKFGATCASSFIGGFIASFATTPLYKMYLSNHYLQSQGMKRFTYKSMYDGFFIETKYASNKNNFRNKFSIWYRYSTAIALRGGIQSLI